MMKSQRAHVGRSNKYLVSDDRIISYPLKEKLEKLLEVVVNINQPRWNELKSVNQPPRAMDMTLHYLWIILGKRIKDWRATRKMLRHQTEEQSVTNAMAKFDPMKVTRKQFKEIEAFIQNRYYDSPEKIRKVSIVCGDIASWIYCIYEILTTQNGLLTQQKVTDLTIGFCKECSCPFEIFQLIVSFCW